MAVGASRVASVAQQEDDHVLVALPMVGFPPGFKLRPGDKVALVNEDDGPEIRPLLRGVELDASPESGAKELTAGGERYLVSEATVRTEGGTRRPSLLVVDNDSGAPPQVMYLRTP